MRISKYPPISALGVDVHQALPPSLPPPPPSPPNPAPIPANIYIVVNNCAMGPIFGKWALPVACTEGMGDILWQYDWGPLQPHVATTPAFLTPTMALQLISSSTKYWLPSFSVQEPTEGGAIQSKGGGTPVAISTPAYLIPTQNCQDISGLGFVGVTSISCQLVSTRWVGFNLGDFIAGYIGMIGDAAAAFVGSYFGGKVFPSSLRGNVAGAFMGLGISALGSLTGNPLLQSFVGAGGLGAGGNRGGGVAGAAFAPVISWLTGLAGTEVGNWGGSRESSYGGRLTVGEDGKVYVDGELRQEDNTSNPPNADVSENDSPPAPSES